MMRDKTFHPRLTRLTAIILVLAVTMMTGCTAPQSTESAVGSTQSDGQSTLPDDQGTPV